MMWTATRRSSWKPGEQSQESSSSSWKVGILSVAERVFIQRGLFDAFSRIPRSPVSLSGEGEMNSGCDVVGVQDALVGTSNDDVVSTLGSFIVKRNPWRKECIQALSKKLPPRRTPKAL